MSFVQAIQEPVNLGLTALVALMAAYWLLVILGLLGLDALDVGFEGPEFDLPTGGGRGADAIIDVLDLPGSEGGAGGGGPELRLVLGRLLNLGYVPASVVLSMLLTSTWGMSVALAQRTDLGAWGQAAALAPILAVGVVFTKIVTLPLRALFRSAEGEDRDWRRAILGHACTVVTSRADESFGRAEVATGGAPLVIEARVRAGRPALAKGEAAVVYGREGAGAYLVEKLAGPEEAGDAEALLERARWAARADRTLRGHAAAREAEESGRASGGVAGRA